MEAYEAIYSRRTTRDFEDKPINHDIIRKIIDAGMHAPTNDHLRQWEFIVIHDKDKRKQLFEPIPLNYSKQDAINIINTWGLTDQDQRDMYIDGIPKQYKMLVNSGCLIIPFFRQEYPLLKPEILSSLNYFASIWCCVENILIAASSEGIQGVVRIPFERETNHIKSALGVPEHYEFPCFISLGYPHASRPSFKQKEYPIDNKIHINMW